MTFDEERPKKTLVHEIGQDISMLSVEELRERIELLRTEIKRLEQVKDQKGSHKSAADAFFKR